MSNMMNLPTDSTFSAGVTTIKNKITAWLGRVNTALVAKEQPAVVSVSEIPQRIQSIKNIKTASFKYTPTVDAQALRLPNPLGVKPTAVSLRFYSVRGTLYNTSVTYFSEVLGVGGGRTASTTSSASYNGCYFPLAEKPSGNAGLRTFYLDENTIMIGKSGSSANFGKGVTYEVKVYYWEE